MIRTRLWREAQENLAPYAQSSATSVGRLHEEPPHPLRTEFQRDCARVIHSQAFRRLEYKTQVFLSGTGDHLRTRLTHTMEVVSISRAMARALGLNEDLAEAIALAHDLGHPPFGHAGERALNEAMREHGGFNHNLQSLRILKRIEIKYPQFDGLNLTYELLEGLQKHRKEFQPREPYARHLPSVYPHQTLEAQLVNLADEIAYYSHDLDDGIDFHLIDPEQLSDLDIWQSTREEVLSRYPNLSGRPLLSYIIRCMIDRTTEDVIQESARRLGKSGVASVNEVRLYPEKLIGYSPAMREANAHLRAFLYRNLYQHPTVESVNESSCDLLRRIFAHFLANPSLLGETSSARIPSDGLHRVVCDYISGMTDRYLLEAASRLS